jgi:hypothetical protein
MSSEPKGQKKCPSCAEMVQVDALICRFCRYDFRQQVVGGLGGPPLGSPTQVGQRKTNGFAIAALVLGIIWIYGIGSILALIFGYKAKGEIDRSAGMQTGRGMAIAGIVLGWVGVAGTIFFWLIFAAMVGSGAMER